MTKSKVIFIMGATRVGKSKLSIDLATLFDAGIVNSDKFQVYMGLDVLTNKITIERGGSRVEDPVVGFKSCYYSCFHWLDVSPSVLHGFVSRRVDEMVRHGLIDEVRGICKEDADYTRGIRRATEVRKMEPYLKAENGHDQTDGEQKKHQLLRAAIDEIKENMCKLTCRQVGKIWRMKEELGWNMMHVNATGAFEKSGEKAQEEWNDSVLGPTTAIVGSFLGRDNNKPIAIKDD